MNELNLQVALLEGWELDHTRPESEGQLKRLKHKRPIYDQSIYSSYGDYDYVIVGQGYSPATNWGQGGPILEKEGISIRKDSFGHFYEPVLEYGEIVCGSNEGKTYLEAGMKAYVAKYQMDKT